MAQQERIEVGEIDPKDLSDEVIEELKEVGSLSEEELENYRNKVELEHMETAEPNKKSLTQVISEYSATTFSGLVDYYKLFRNKKTTYVTISNVETDDDGTVVLHMEHPRIDTSKLDLDSKSKELANLMGLHKVESPYDLEGKWITVNGISQLDPYSSHWSREYLFPHNTSFSGRLRYKSFSLVQTMREKIKIWFEEDEEDIFFGLIMFTLFCTIPGLIGSLLIFDIGGTIITAIGAVLLIPLLISATVTGLYTVILIFKLILITIWLALRSEYKEISD